MQGDVVFVAEASVWLEDDPVWMLERHRAEGNALTVFCTPGLGRSGSGPNGSLKPAGLYCCDRAVLDFIPEYGYYDLKEQLVPALQREGLRVGAVTLPHQTCKVIDWATYLHALTRAFFLGRFQDGRFRQIAPEIWCGEGVEIAPQARVVGPALLGHGCRVADGAVVMGPTILGDGSYVGPGSWLIRVVAPHGVRFPAGTSVADQVVTPAAAEPELEHAAESVGCQPPVADSFPEKPRRVHDKAPSPEVGRSGRVRERIPAPAWSASRRLAKVCLVGGMLAGLFVWAFLYSFIDLWHVWQSSADYGAGQVVPFAALYMIAMRRRALSDLRMTLDVRGIGVFAVGLVSNLIGNYYLFASLENVGLVLCANGLAMSLLGFEGYKRVWYPLLFLFLMIPLPNRIHDAVMLPLQEFGARVSAGVLEIIGVPAARSGNILEVAGHQVAVAEACNGLRMALAFLIVAGFLAYVVRRPQWQKTVIVFSSVPIALSCNIARIVVSACLYSAGYEWLAQGMFHTLAGLLMMPLALCLILLELWFLSKLVAGTEHGPKVARPASSHFRGTASPGAAV